MILSSSIVTEFQHFWSLTHACLNPFSLFRLVLHFGVIFGGSQAVLSKTNLVEFVWNSWCLQHVPMQHRVQARVISCVFSQHETSCILLPVWCGHTIWSLWGSPRQRRDSQRRRQEAGSSDSSLVDVTLTENRGGHVGVSRQPDTPRNASPLPSTLF